MNISLQYCLFCRVRESDILVPMPLQKISQFQLLLCQTPKESFKHCLQKHPFHTHKLYVLKQQFVPIFFLYNLCNCKQVRNYQQSAEQYLHIKSLVKNSDIKFLLTITILLRIQINLYVFIYKFINCKGTTSVLFLIFFLEIFFRELFCLSLSVDYSYKKCFILQWFLLLAFGK